MPKSHFNKLNKTNAMDTDSCQASQEIPHFLWNPKVHTSVHNSWPLDPIQSQLYLVPILTSYFSRHFAKHRFLL